ncbi:Tn3 family transposase [Streptomyces caeni]|uniref:Tn3 family transposase n=1 Tax=Streptomyces caeni TaxID=2307231 RepID=A0ABW4IY93_9ACTN
MPLDRGNRAALSPGADADSHMEGFTTSLCPMLLSEACHVGMIPVIKPDVPELTRGCLVQIDQGYFRVENISAGNARFIEAQPKIDVVHPPSGGSCRYALAVL